MQKRINIQSLLQAKATLKNDSFDAFLSYYGVEIKLGELEDLKVMHDALTVIWNNVTIFDKFYVGYKIPQIGKEFDLLRFGAKSIINIELKSNATEEKIKTQLMRNKYYLSFIGKTVHSYTFVSEFKKLYVLDANDVIQESNLNHLASLLADQELATLINPDDLFNPSDYLVSPFNATGKFLGNAYFLTNQQEDVKKEILKLSKNSAVEQFISITGGAGTGKTLLTYDIAKQLLKSEKKPLIFHCGLLNNGHLQLVKSGWQISAIKDYANRDLAKHKIIIIDEAQRIYPETLAEIVKKVKALKCCCIFSHDKLQTLSNSEEKRDSSSIISSIDSIKQYKLSEKIRTNKEIAAFIKMLFNNSKTLPISNNGNIEINYFSTVKLAKNYLDELDESEWEILRFTPSQYNTEHHKKYSDESSKTSHQVIGQEFDGVAVTIDQFFRYDNNGDLIYSGDAYYAAPKMLRQNLTRSRRKLNLIIIGNEELLNRCIAILQ
jgi:hypothetical protein